MSAIGAYSQFLATCGYPKGTLKIDVQTRVWRTELSIPFREAMYTAALVENGMLMLQPASLLCFFYVNVSK